MCINVLKTKVMSALIPGEQRQAVLLDGEPLEDVEKFKSLFTMLMLLLGLHFSPAILSLVAAWDIVA